MIQAEATRREQQIASHNAEVDVRRIQFEIDVLEAEIIEEERRVSAAGWL